MVNIISILHPNLLPFSVKNEFFISQVLWMCLLAHFVAVAHGDADSKPALYVVLLFYISISLVYELNELMNYGLQRYANYTNLAQLLRNGFLLAALYYLRNDQPHKGRSYTAVSYEF